MLYCDCVIANVLQTGIETVLAESLSEISQKIHGYSGIKRYHIPFLPCHLYIEAPGIAEIQEFMKFSAYGHLMSCAACILVDIDCNFLHSAHVPDVPCTRSWVQIIQPGVYKGDLAVVFFMPSTGDIVMITVVPHFQDKKRKGKGNARPAPALLDPTFVAKFPANGDNVHSIGSHNFTSNGLEFLQVVSAHGLKIKPCPSEAELFSFHSFFGIVDKTFELDLVIQCAVNKAFHNESRRLWHLEDWVQIVEGAFVDMTYYIHEIDKENQSIVAKLDSPILTCIEVSLEDMEQKFLVGDQVRVVLGENKRRMGSIVEINDGVGTIVEQMANKTLLYSLLILPSSNPHCSILRAMTYPLLLPSLLIWLLHQ